MILFKQAKDVENFIAKQRLKGNAVGFVPTMGALHQGHISLLEMCKQQNDTAVCSIFVNPTQFNDPKDFQKYPVTIANDILKLQAVKCDVLLIPSVEEMYPNGVKNESSYQIFALENLLEGAYRPGHFQGVSQVVHRLLDIVNPDKIYLGQKDYQQVLVIKSLISQLQKKILVVVGETLRETSGLAMSSRNMRLNEQERNKAAEIFKSLNFIKKEIANKPIEELTKQAETNLLNAGFTKVDYVSVANAETLQPVKRWNKKTMLVVLVATFIAGVRLIDNLVIEPPEKQ